MSNPTWFTRSMSKECQECGMPYEDNLWEQSHLCDDCREKEEIEDGDYLDYDDIEDDQ
jgi:hypothetical protein